MTWADVCPTGVNGDFNPLWTHLPWFTQLWGLLHWRKHRKLNLLWHFPSNNSSGSAVLTSNRTKEVVYFQETTCDSKKQKQSTTKQTKTKNIYIYIYIYIYGGRNSSLVVSGFAVHSVAGSILLWGNFQVEGIFPLELTWAQTPFPPKLFRMRVYTEV